MDKYLTFTAFLISTAVCLGDNFDQEFEHFKSRHERSYKTDLEEQFRKKIFIENCGKIKKHNEQYVKGNESFFLGITPFADLLQHEHKSMMNGYRPIKKTNNFTTEHIRKDTNLELPAEVDWRKKGAVTPVKNQGFCGSCWAFGAVGAMEGQWAIRTGKLIPLSQQDLMDCSLDDGGCDGGMPEDAINFVIEHGISTEQAYPYNAGSLGIEKCKHRAPNAAPDKFKSLTRVKSQSESDLKAAVAITPVVVGIDANHEKIQHYSGGVFNVESCSTTDLDHAVLVVGYGTDEATGEDYWLVKNSWGVYWGEGGYIRMARNKNNMCGIATDACFPVV